ncbi:MAG: 50S ribosomal protein L11 methyltransferase, partial [Bacteroidales bacterium]|nr:50S ribosomal protein L11 methyltransferase [Bacteroidales bacterium]
GCESFNEEDKALLAYISADIYHKNLFNELNFLKDHPEVNIDVKPLEEINWNKEWESNYPPVTIAGKCHVRAPFHPPVAGIPFEIVIEPKMAFGTAHHETTHMMAEWLMGLDVKGKDILDMGCGTGILAILANKMGANTVIGIDNDEWAWRNARENFRNNGVLEDHVFLGDASLMIKEGYDLILANINRNVLLQDMNAYFSALRINGSLLLSGFYVRDIEAIKAAAMNCGFHFTGSGNLKDWAVVLFHKKS